MPSETREDAAVGLFLSRELDKVLDRVFDVTYADIKYSMILPISTEVGPANESYTYRVYDKTGEMKIIQDRAHDLPRADVVRKEVTHNVRSLGGSIAYTVQELRHAALVPGMSIDQRRLMAERRAYEEAQQKIAYWGNPAVGLKGFFNSTEVDKLVPDKWFDTVGITPDEQLEILNEACTRIVQNSNMKEMPDSMLVPYPVFRKISQTPRSTTSDTTVMEYFLRTNPYITNIEPINELEAAKSGGNLSKDRIITYQRSPEKLEFHIPQPLEFFPPERRGLEYQVAAHARTGGVALYYPKSVHVTEKA